MAHPPGPRGLPILGNLLDMLRDPLGFLIGLSRQYGDVVKFSLPGQQVYLFNHPNAIQEVLVSQSEHFVKGGRKVSLVLGNGLLTSDGAFWQRQRRLAQPAFHLQRVHSYGDVIVRYAERAVSMWKDMDTRDIHRDMGRLTLEVVSKTLFDIEVMHVAEEIERSLAVLVEYFFSLSVLLSLPLSLPTPGNLRVRKALKRLDEIIYGIIAQRQKQGDCGDVLSMLLAARSEEDGAMNSAQVRDEALTLMLAGHETTALSLTFALYLISRHPEVEKRLYAEIKEVLGDRPATAADLPKLRVADAVLRESMRLYPPAWSIGRQAASQCHIAGYDIPPGTQVYLAQWVVHRDPRYFANPEAFLPERWEGDLAKRLPRYAYFPFGGGPRICIANAFAMMESVLLLCTIVRRVRLLPIDDRPLELLPQFTLRPKYGMPLRIERRAPTA